MRVASPHLPGAVPGFTLIELTVSIVIVGVLLSAAVIGIGGLVGTRAKGAVGELGGVIRSLYDTAGLTGKTCRLVLELGPKEPSTSLSYHAECAKQAVTRSAADDEKAKDKDRRRDNDESGASAAPPFPSALSAPSLEDLTNRERDRVEGAAQYSSFTSPEIKPRQLDGLKVSVWTAGAPRAITSGTAYLYFFPQGYTERAQVVIEQGANAWTLKVSPLTGKTTVVGEKLEPPR